MSRYDDDYQQCYVDIMEMQWDMAHDDGEMEKRWDIMRT